MMETTKVKVIDLQKERARQVRGENWKVMKPFVKFSFHAIRLIGLGLLTIIKMLPGLKPHSDITIKRR